MKKILYVLMILSLLVGGNVQISAQTKQPSKEQLAKQKQKEKEKAAKEKEKAKAKAAKEKEKAKAAKEKEKAKAAQDKERAKAQAAKDSERAKEQAAKDKEAARKAEEEEKLRQAYYKQQEELANPKEKPNHYFNLSPRVGYSAMMDKNQAPANLSAMTSGKQQNVNRSLLGGVGAGLGINYNLEYKHFLFETGLDFELLTSTSRYGYDFTRQDANYGAIYHYMVDCQKESRMLYNVGLPVMFGAEFNNIYFLLGARVGYDLGGNYKQKGQYDIIVEDPALLEPYGLGINDIPAPADKKLSFKAPDLKVCAELGLDLDQWMQQQPDPEKAKKNKIKPGERYPFGREHVHYRVGLFAEYGVLNTNNMSTALPMNFAADNEKVQSTNSLLAMEGTKLNNLFVGAKFTIQFQVPGKTPAVVPAPPSFARYVVVDQATGKVLPHATIETTQTNKGNKVVIKEKALGKKGEIKQKHGLGTYTVVAKAADYYDVIESFDITTPDTVVEMRLALRHRPVLRVRVYNKETGAIVPATVRVRNAETQAEAIALATDSVSGTAKTMLAEGAKYYIHIAQFGYDTLETVIANVGDSMNIALSPVKKGEKFIVKNLFFATNKTRILSTSEEALSDLYNYLNRNPQVRIRIIGHTDSVGKDAANQKLSEGRANAVMQDLISRGLAADRLEAEGRGETQPIDTNDTEEGRQNNRRVEIEIL